MNVELIIPLKHLHQIAGVVLATSSGHFEVSSSAGCFNCASSDRRSETQIFVDLAFLDPDRQNRRWITATSSTSSTW